METKKKGNFIRNIVEKDLAEGRHETVVTRFPPEPNGYLHIGHAKSVCLNFGLAKDYGGRCHLRFDDTNPEKEDIEYVESIKRDIEWLGWSWNGHLYYASDYFERLYAYAEELIRAGKAYVCSLSPEEMNEYRGSLTEPGRPSPDRDRPVEENLDLFRRMRAGEFPDGAYTLRAKIDMSSPNVHMRDPALYRIRHKKHWRTGDQWCIYPMYDYTHCISDAIEGITHSLCSLEFEVHRPLYDWVLDNISIDCHPRQIEFARLNLSYTVMSKRKLLRLVKEGYVSGWDDPRMPTLAGLRRRGYTPESIRRFIEEIGLAKADSVVDAGMLESCIRDDLNRNAPRAMAVLDPVRLTIVDYPEDKVEELEAPNYPDEPGKMGYRKIPFCRELFIERSDFMEDPPRKFYRLAPGREVRLRWAYLVTCVDVVRDESGAVVEILCRHDPDSRGGNAPDGRRVRGTIHWVSARHAFRTELRIYDRLFSEPSPEACDGDFTGLLNPESLVVNDSAVLERSLASAGPGDRFQFERTGYFVADIEDSRDGKPVFNRIVPLKDSWARKMAARTGGSVRSSRRDRGSGKERAAGKDGKDGNNGAGRSCDSCPGGDSKSRSRAGGVTDGKRGRNSSRRLPDTPETIDFEQFCKVKLVVARIEKCERIEGADRLLKLVLDAGDEGKPTVCAGIARHYSPDELTGRKVIWVANLAPRKMRGVLSMGMVLAADLPGGGVRLIAPPDGALIGSRVS